MQVTPTNKPGRVSVVIPSKNEGDWVQRTVQQVLQVGGPLKEVLIVDDGSTDGSCDNLEDRDRFEPVRVIQTAGVGASAARNLGAADASGDILVFLDAHSLPEQGWLEEICEVLDMGHAMAAGLLIPFDHDENPLPYEMLGRWYIPGRLPWEVCHWPAPKGDAIPIGYGACQAFQAKAFQMIGGYCEELPFGLEDMEVCVRMWGRGGTIGAAPGARVRTLMKDWGRRPDKDEIGLSMWINQVKHVVLHWSPVRLTAMWSAIAEEWKAYPGLYDAVWEACQEPSVIELRRRYRSEATLSDDDLFGMFAELPGQVVRGDNNAA